MPKSTLVPIEGHLPRGYVQAYTTSELARVEKRYEYHPERFFALFYDAVSGSLRGGRTVYFPLGVKRRDMPVAIRFEFEKHQFKVLLPEPRHPNRRAIICVKEPLGEQDILRAAHFFSDLFVAEYKRFYSGAIKDSKQAKDVE